VTSVDISGGLSSQLLDPNDCFILDCETEIFVWVGKESTEQEKAAAMANAQDFLSSMGRPSWTPITKLGQGCESALFKSKFVKGNWVCVPLFLFLLSQFFNLSLVLCLLISFFLTPCCFTSSFSFSFFFFSFFLFHFFSGGIRRKVQPNS
jgi:hypothetical protein